MLLARILSYASSVSKQSAFIFLFSVAVPFWLLSFALVQMKDEDSGGERGGTEIITSQQMLRLCQNSNSLWCPALEKKLVRFDPTECSPIHRLGYAKTYKTGSSTMANILYRYAETRNWNPFLSNASASRLWTDKTLLDKSRVTSIPWHIEFFKNKKYDFFGAHKSWDIDSMRALLGDSAKYVTIIRKPLNIIESRFGYFYQQRENYNKSKRARIPSIEEYIRGLETNPSFREANNQCTVFLQIGKLRTQMGRELTPSEIKEKVAMLSEEFDFVALLERLSESLVLMSQKFCIPLKHLTSIRKKNRGDANKHTLRPDLVAILKRLQYADEILYDYFEAVFHQRAKRFGLEKLEVYKRQLEELNAYVVKKCQIKEVYEGRIFVSKSELGTDECNVYTLEMGDTVSRARKLLAAKWFKTHPPRKVINGKFYI